MAVKKGKLIADEAVVRLVNHLGLEAASKKLNVVPCVYVGKRALSGGLVR